MMKLVLPVLLSSAVFASTVDRDGVAGIDKTFSAQTLHHGKLAIGVHTHVIDDAQRFVANQPFSLRARSFSQSPNLLMQRKLTCVNTEALSGAPQFPTWG